MQRQNTMNGGRGSQGHAGSAGVTMAPADSSLAAARCRAAVLPALAAEHGFGFHFPELAPALADLCAL